MRGRINGQTGKGEEPERNSKSAGQQSVGTANAAVRGRGHMAGFGKWS